MPERGQTTLSGPSQTALDRIQSPEPRDENDVPQVVTTSSTNGRGSYHKQDAHATEIAPACNTVLRGTASTWVLKPKGAMERSSTTPCGDPACYGGEGDV